MNNYRLLVLINSLFFAAIGISAPLLTLFFEEELGANKSQIALVLTSIGLLMLIGNYSWGRISDRLGRRKPIWAGGLFGVALTSLLLSQSPDINSAWLLRMAGTLATAAYTTLSLAIMADVFSQTEAKAKESGKSSSQKGRQMGFYRGLGSFAFAIGATLGGRLADVVSLRAAFIACSILYLLAGICALLLKEEENQENEENEEQEDGIKERINTPSHKERGSVDAASSIQPDDKRLPALFLAGVALWTMAHTASASMWPNYMSELGYSKTWIGGMWGLAAFIEFPAMYLAGIISDLIGTAIVLAAGGFLIAVVNMGYLLFAVYLPALLSIQIVRGVGFASYTTTAMTFTTDFGVQRTRGRTSGIFYTAASIGSLLGSYIGGTLADWRGFGFMYGFCAISAVVAGLCFLRLRQQQR